MGGEQGREGEQRRPEADSCLEHREDPKPQLELKEGECPGEERGGLGCIQSFSSVLQLSWADSGREQGTPKRRTLQHWERRLIKSRHAEDLFKCV